MNYFNTAILVTLFAAASSKDATHFQPLLYPNVMTPELLQLAKPMQEASAGLCNQVNFGHCLTQYYAHINLNPPVQSPNQLFNQIQDLLYQRGQRGLIQACSAEQQLFQCLVTNGTNQPAACLSIPEYVSMGVTLSDAYRYYAFRQQQGFMCGGGYLVYLQNLPCILTNSLFNNATLSGCVTNYQAQIAKHPATVCSIAAPQFMSCEQTVFQRCSAAVGWEACEITRLNINAALPLCSLRCNSGSGNLKQNEEIAFTDNKLQAMAGLIKSAIGSRKH